LAKENQNEEDLDVLFPPQPPRVYCEWCDDLVEDCECWDYPREYE